MASVRRKWLNREEIQELFQKEMGPVEERITEKLRNHVDESFARFAPTLDLLRDGAQQTLLTAAILHGNKDFGLEGHIPATERRLTWLEKHVRMLVKGQRVIRSKQNIVIRLMEFLTAKTESGNPRYVAWGGLLSGLVTAGVVGVKYWAKFFHWIHTVGH